MAAKRRDRSRKGPDLTKVLQGKAQPAVLELLSLISEVNPTDRDLPSREEEERYRIKSQLQGLLIARFPEELEVHPEAAEDVALIRHRATGYGCHARISGLDEEARFWVLRRLDEERSFAPQEAPAVARRERREIISAESPSPREDLPPEALVRRGQAALEEYDYGEARDLFALALERSRGGVGEALALLELLVDHLGAYHEALATMENLPGPTLAHRRVRALRAMAAASTGDTALAEAQLRGLDGPRAMEATLVLTRLALAEGRLDEASQHLAMARKGGAEALEVERLSEEVAAQVTLRWRPAEEELARALEKGQEVEAMARDLLSRWPESPVAQRVMGQIERRRREEEASGLLEKARQALGQGQRAEAAALAKQALPLGADTEAVEDLLAEVQAQETEARAGQAVALVVEGLRGQDRPAGLRAYLALDQELRERAREESCDEALGWLDEAGVPSTGSRALAAVEAVLALEAAGRMVDGDIEGAYGLLSPHERLIRALKVGRALWDRAERGVAQARLDRAERALGLAQVALSEGRLAEAREAMKGLDPRHLPQERQAEARVLGEELMRAEEERRLRDQVDQLEAEGAFFEARRTLERLLAMGVEVREGRHRELNERVREQWRIQVVEGEGLDLYLDLDMEMDKLRLPCLIRDGKTLLIPSFWGSWAFIRELDVPSGRLTKGVMFRLPRVSNNISLVARNTLWLAALHPSFLVQMDCSTWDILRWVGPEVFGEDEEMNALIPFPDGSLAWLSYDRERSVDLHVIDLDRPRFRRERSFSRLDKYHLLYDEDPTFVLTTETLKLSVVTHQWEERFRCDLPPLFQTLLYGSLGPDGRGLLLVCDFRDLGENQPQKAIIWVSQEGESSAVIPLPATKAHQLETAQEQGLSFLIFSREDGRRFLAAWRLHDRTPEEVYRVEVPSGTWLIRDVGFRHVVALVATELSIRVWALGEEAPPINPCVESRFAVGGTFVEWDPPSVRCDDVWVKGGRTYHKEENKFDLLSERGKRAYLGRLLEGSDQKQLMDLYRSLWHKHHEPLRRQLLAFTAIHYPDSAFFGLAQAEELTEQRRWGEAMDLLKRLPEEPISLRGLDEAQIRHLYHLLGLAEWWLGHDDLALDFWNTGAHHKGECKLEQLADLVAEIPDPPRPNDWGPDKGLVIQLRGAIRSADLALEKGDGEGTIRLLESFFTRGFREIQLLARLAEAYLMKEARSPEEHFNKALVLAKFCWCHQDLNKRGSFELPLRQGLWPRERLEELTGRAEGWLEGQGGRNQPFAECECDFGHGRLQQ